jgi:hypothetical protein
VASSITFAAGNNIQITGDNTTKTVTITATGSASNISNGTSNVAVVSSGGNVTVGIGGTGNVAVFANTGLAVTGIASVSGNVTGGNVSTAGLITATGNVNGGNILTGGLVSATGNLFAGNALISGNLTVNGNVTYINSNVVTINDLAINLANNAATAAAADGGGIEVGPQGSPYITWLYNNSANVFTSSAGISAVGNISGANLRTAGVITAAGNVTGGNLISNANIVATSAANVTFGDNTWFYSGYTTMNTGGIFHDTGANPDTIQVSTNSRANGIAMFTVGGANSGIVSTGGIEFITGGTLNANSYPTGGTSQVQITAAGLNVAGNVTATGNVTGNYFIGNGSQLTGLSGGGNVQVLTRSLGTLNIPVISGALVLLSRSGNINIPVIA